MNINNSNSLRCDSSDCALPQRDSIHQKVISRLNIKIRHLSTINANELPSALATSAAQLGAKWMNSIKSTELKPRTYRKIRHHSYMKDEMKLAGAFLALNAAVIALAVAGYVKSGMNFRAVLEHLR